LALSLVIYRFRWSFAAFVGIRDAPGLLPFSLASAFCFWSISVAPVRGGTPISLLLQRKGGKRKQLQTPVPARIAPRHIAAEPSRSDVVTL
jgi:hypothetical protein